MQKNCGNNKKEHLRDISSRKLNVLHICNLENSKTNGIAVVVPCHVKEQAKYANVVLQNISNIILMDRYQEKYESKNWPFNILKGKFIPDLVVFHGFYDISCIKLYKRLVKFNIKYIIVPHVSLTINAQKSKKTKKIIGNYLFFNDYVSKAQAIQCLSKYEYDNTIVNNKKILSTNGINIPKVQKVSFSDNLRFTFIGRLDIVHKGLDLMLNAIRLKKDFLIENKCMFNIYGPSINNSKNKLNELIKNYKLEKLVFINDTIVDKQKELVLLESDIFIQTSRFEGMPMGILEALSYGVPSLVTYDTTLGELIEKYDAGFSCITNEEEIAEALQKVILQKDRLLNKSKNAIRLIKEKFNWNQIASQAILEYKKIIISGKSKQ